MGGWEVGGERGGGGGYLLAGDGDQPWDKGAVLDQGLPGGQVQIQLLQPRVVCLVVATQQDRAALHLQARMDLRGQLPLPNKLDVYKVPGFCRRDTTKSLRGAYARHDVDFRSHRCLW